ncbi:HAD-IC family P-type ATPase, partial [Corynebacterium hesseae]|uniref:HAD-IC family P-type ATPase n=1 Tax=Corynebacterium hesseae TaxID=2913502 RepID=UPI00373E136D
SAVDESLLTGESLPVEVSPGSTVTGATINASGRLEVRATRVGSDTVLAQMGALVTAAQTSKAPVQRLADRIAAVFVPIVIGIAILALVAHLWVGGVAPAFVAAVSVLIIACPCAMGLATPTAILVGTGRGAELGILIKGPEILESTRQIDTIVLDKTGTITEGQMSVAAVQATAGHSEQILQRTLVSAALSLPVMLLSMVPALQFQNWQWACLVLTTLVYVIGGAPFHRATWANLKHGAATMDTLITLGTTAAFGWSLYALFFGNAGMPGMTMHMTLRSNDAQMDHIYLESVGMVITFLLLGRWFELKAKGRSSEALTTLLTMGAKEATVLRGDTETRIPIGDLHEGDIFVVRPGEKIATDGVVLTGH